MKFCYLAMKIPMIGVNGINMKKVLIVGIIFTMIFTSSCIGPVQGDGDKSGGSENMLNMLVLAAMAGIIDIGLFNDDSTKVCKFGESHIGECKLN